MDVTRAEMVEKELDTIIERRAKQRQEANELEEFWKRSEEKHHERERREHLAAWYDFHLTLADSHRKLSQEHEQRALALLEMDGG